VTDALLSPLVCDASFCHEYEMAAIAFGCEDGKILGTEIVSAKNANHAEALSVIRATSFIAARRVPPGQVILTDSLMTVRCLEGRNSGEQFFMAAIVQLRRWHEIRQFDLRHVPRHVVARAHGASWHALRAWKIGAGLKERWKPPSPQPRLEPA
jgi:hypothetical protein